MTELGWTPYYTKHSSSKLIFTPIPCSCGPPSCSATMQLSTALLTLLAIGGSSVSASPRYQPQQVAPRQAPPRGQVPAPVAALLSQLPAGSPDPLDFFPKTFGVQRGIPFGDASADCRGAKPGVRIDCSCPPDVDDPTFRAAVKIGLYRGFFPEPTVTVPINITQWDNNGQLGDADLQLRRNQVMVIALQSLQGIKGKGCPGVSAPALGAGQG